MPEPNRLHRVRLSLGAGELTPCRLIEGGNIGAWQPNVCHWRTEHPTCQFARPLPLWHRGGLSKPHILNKPKWIDLYSVAPSKGRLGMS